MSIDFQDGGAFAECCWVQYPKGLGRQPLAPTTVSRLEHLQAATPLSTTTVPFLSPVPSATSAAASATTSAAPASSSLALTVISTAEMHRKQGGTGASKAVAAVDKEQELEDTTARTRQAITATLEAKQHPHKAMAEAAFDGKRLGKGSGALTISTAATTAASLSADPAPIVRSPTKAPKRSVLEVEAQERRLRGGEDESSAPVPLPASGVAVPFAVSNWRNKKNLIIPVEQRLAQQQDERTSGRGGIGSRVMDLALAMRKAEKGVNQELQQRATARAAEEERRQAALEAEEMEKAKRLMEENAARLAQQQQQQSRRGETREQRLERLKLERELREREMAQKQRQRQLAKAAARLNMRVEDLEADESLLHALERGSAPTDSGATVHQQHHHPHRSGTSGTAADGLLLQPGGGAGGAFKHEKEAEDRDEDEDDTGKRKKPSFQMFMRPVVSNEGIAREMAALAALERDSGSSGGGGGGGGGAPDAHGRSDGIRLPEAEDEDKDDSDGDEDGGFAMDQLVSKRQRLL